MLASRAGQGLIFGSCKVLQKNYYNNMRQIKGILLLIILTEAASKRGYPDTGMASQTKLTYVYF